MPARPNPSLTPKQRRAVAQDLAARIITALDGEKLAARFIEGYSKQFQRKEFVVHAERNRELQAIFNREILLAMLTRISVSLAEQTGSLPRSKKPASAPNLDAFLSDVLDAIGRARRWTAGDTFEIRGELNLYRDIVARSAGAASRQASTASAGPQFRFIPSGSRERRASGSGPFVDRCAFVLDPSMMENARVASAKFLREIEALADRALEESLNAIRAQKK